MKVKYVHLLWRNENKFNDKVIRLINDPGNGFNVEDHLFVFNCKSAYDKCTVKAENVILDESRNLFQKYGKSCDWIISHAIRAKVDLLLCPKKYLKKVIFRYWGGQISGFGESNSKGIKRLIKKVLAVFYQRKLNQLAAIGIANDVDVVHIRKSLKKTPLYPLPYSTPDGYDIFLQTKAKQVGYTFEKCNVLLGHRGTSEEDHIKLLELLERKFGDRIEIFAPLSYGDSHYISEVKQFVERKKWSNVHLIFDFLPYREYQELLAKMNVAVLNSLDSYALGTICSLLFFGQKLYLNEAGVIAETFDLKSIPYGAIGKIGLESYNDFIKPVFYDSKSIDSFVPHCYEYRVNKWKEFLNDFN